MDNGCKYKIIGDVYEVREDGALVKVPKQRILSRLSYTHERCVIVERNRTTLSRRAAAGVLGTIVIIVTSLLLWWLLFHGLLL